MREIEGSCIHCVTIGAKPFATRRRSRSFVPLLRHTERRPKLEFTQPSTFCGPIPDRMFVPRSGTRANSCVTSTPSVESAITTDAGPQLFSDCHTCFISSNTTEAGAAFGSGAGIATATGSAAGAVTATCAESGAPSAAAGPATFAAGPAGLDKDGTAANAALHAASTKATPSARRAAGRLRIVEMVALGHRLVGDRA